MMTIRSAPPLAAALALLAAPALAQDSATEEPPPAAAAPLPPVETAVETSPAADEATPDADPRPAPAEATPAAPESAAAEPPAPAPAPAAAPPTAARAIPPSPFSPDQRNGWLAQCRSAFQRAGAALGGGNGLPDACDTQLTSFERNYVPAADGQPPVIFVRVPVVRAPAAPAAPEPGVDADPDAGAEE